MFTVEVFGTGYRIYIMLEQNSVSSIVKGKSKLQKQISKVLTLIAMAAW